MSTKHLSKTQGQAVRVRAALLRDVPELLRIEVEAFESDRLTAQSLRNLIRAETATVHVAELTPGHLVGFCIVLFRRGTVVARLYSMAVDHTVRGQGVAQALMLAMEADAAQRGALFLRLEVRHDNVPAIRLYESVGFVKMGVRKRYYRISGADAYTMRREAS